MARKKSYNDIARQVQRLESLSLDRYRRRLTAAFQRNDWGGYDRLTTEHQRTDRRINDIAKGYQRNMGHTSLNPYQSASRVIYDDRADRKYSRSTYMGLSKG